MHYYYRIRELREKYKLTQQQIAGLLHCSQQTYNNYESGKRKIPARILIRLVEIYHVRSDYILELTDEQDF